MKFFGLLVLGFLMGCSSSSKKETSTTPSTKPATTAATTAPTAPAPKEDAAPKTSAKSKTEKTSTQTAAGDVVCVSGKEERKLSIKPKNSGCELEYTKMGQASMVASQINGQEKCDEVLTKIKDKLVAAGYKCE